MVLQAMQPIYALVGLNPWNFFSVTANAERTVATIKQYTRWGISDIYILALYFEKAEVINAEVKRFKERSVVLNNGRVLEEIDHIIKVIGFDGDFGVDRLMKCTVNIGPWPHGDWRRFTLSDNSAIDASRFTNIAISPAVSSLSFMCTYYFQHPEAGFACLATGMLPENKSEPEVGSPCYHYEPRKGMASMMVVYGISPELGVFDELNGKMKKCSLHHIASPEKYQAACERDWMKYCRLFKDQGCTKPFPAYPVSVEDAKRLLQLEQELEKQEQQKWMTRMGIPQEDQQKQQQEDQPAAVAAEPDGWEDDGEDEPQQPPPLQERQQVQTQEQRWPQQDMDFIMPQFQAGDRESFEPARRVLQARLRSQSPARDDAERRAWLKEGHEVKDFLIRATRRTGSPKALKG
mmetsp:Transcript_114297/g.318177  ORF Transcript_114297/g.318177 Transcript_114297/m.318177 type:complete len:406 (+) Transcript_114297:3-1220(+)